MGFKDYLIESSLEHVIKAFDVKKMDLDDLKQAYKNAGYEIAKSEERYFLESYYVGFKPGSGHAFAVAMEDDGGAQDEDKPYYVSLFWVTIGHDGKIEAEPSGNPVKSDIEDEKEAKKLAKEYHLK